MEAVKKANKGREACEEPHLSFRDVSLSMVNRISMPHGYRIATAQELEKSFNGSSSFNYELSEIGAAWARPTLTLFAFFPFILALNIIWISDRHYVNTVVILRLYP